MKNIEKFKKLYEEEREKHFLKWTSYYPPKTWEELYAWDNESFEECLKEQVNDVKKTKLYLSILDTTNDFGFYIAFQKLDYELINNVIYQTSRQKLLHRGMLASGTDHCNVLLDLTSNFACNDFKVIDSFLPKELALAKGTYYTEVSVNLLKIMYYSQEELAITAIERAAKFLTKKITAIEEYVVKYFLALYNRDLTQINICLQELCKAYQRQGYPKSKLDKCVAFEIHGLYRFARLIDNEFFEKIQRPKHACFFEEFELWHKENKYPKGVAFYKYPTKMNYMNKIFQAKIPKITLIENTNGKRKELYKDVEKFAFNLTENIRKIE